MVSTQPELPVRCCTAHASAISTESATAIQVSASRYKMVMQNPAKSLTRQTFMKYAQVNARFHAEVPSFGQRRPATGFFLSPAVPY
jgi:putative hemolysin